MIQTAARFIAFYPEREQELVERIKEGRFDIGGSFHQPFEETLSNEPVAARALTELIMIGNK